MPQWSSAELMPVRMGMRVRMHAEALHELRIGGVLPLGCWEWNRRAVIAGQPLWCGQARRVHATAGAEGQRSGGWQIDAHGAPALKIWQHVVRYAGGTPQSCVNCTFQGSVKSGLLFTKAERAKAFVIKVTGHPPYCTAPLAHVCPHHAVSCTHK